jgi:undecaprenyl pyrophosphate synthase
MVLDTLWPDFGESDIVKCVEAFYSRDRRFGGLSQK